MKQDLLLKAILFFLSIIFLSSCKVSQLGLGTAYDTGSFGQRSSGEFIAERPGLFMEYRWQKMKEEGKTGFGIDANLHMNGYTDDYDGDLQSFQTVQGKYYYTLLQPEEKTYRLDVAGGFGLGTMKGYGWSFDPIALANVSLDFHLPKKELFYISTKFNYLRQLNQNRHGISLQLGVGVRLTKR